MACPLTLGSGGRCRPPRDRLVRVGRAWQYGRAMSAWCASASTCSARRRPHTAPGRSPSSRRRSARSSACAWHNLRGVPLSKRAPNKPECHGTALRSVAVEPSPLSHLRARHSAWRKGTPGTLLSAKGHVRRLEQRSPIRRLPCPQDPAHGPEASRESTAGAGQGPPTNLDQGGRLEARRGVLHKRQRERVERGRGQEALGLHGQRGLRSAEHACLGRLPRSTPCARSLRCLSTCIMIRQRGLGLPGSRTAVETGQPCLELLLSRQGAAFAHKAGLSLLGVAGSTF